MNKSGGMEYAPLRSLDDFLLGSARFQIPNFSDWEKWGNRVTSNLIYYQTNYFLMSILIFIVFGIMHPLQMVIGFLVLIVVSSICAYAFNESGSMGQFKRKHPIISNGVILAISYFLLSTVLGSFIIFLIALLIPFCSIFIHSSLRLRSVKNKLVNTIEPISMKTPMGIFLYGFGLETKSKGVPDILNFNSLFKHTMK